MTPGVEFQPLTLAAEAAGAAGIGPVRTALVVILVAMGSFFLLVGTIGLIRLPNVYNRMHATSKAATLGAGAICLAGWAYYFPAGDGLLGLVTVVFLFLTAPTGAHMISRSAQRMGVPFLDGVHWPGRADSDPEEPAPGDD
jgi:multicomponent Na+:H+ antiporter subunit G